VPAYRPIKERLLAKVEPCPATGCWLFTGGATALGYGVIGRERAPGTRKAHRVSYECFKGAIPKGMAVRHLCDVPACVAPHHLELGTLGENARDTVRRKRHRIPDNAGEKATWALLDWGRVRHIRKREMTQQAYATLYGVSRSTVNQVQRNAIWKE
jgi:predicted XRE-type DNA-binding protein